MQTRLVAALALSLAALPACGPPPPPPPAPAPAPAAPSPVDSLMAEIERRAQAERLFDEGVLAGRRSQWQEAEVMYRSAARVLPTEPRYHLALAAALQQQGKLWEAADALRAGIEAEEALPRPNHRVLVTDYDRLIALLTRTGRTGEVPMARYRQDLAREARDAAAPY